MANQAMASQASQFAPPPHSLAPANSQTKRRKGKKSAAVPVTFTAQALVGIMDLTLLAGAALRSMEERKGSVLSSPPSAHGALKRSRSLRTVLPKSGHDTDEVSSDRARSTKHV